MSTVPIEFNAKNPKIMATFTIDDTTSGSTLQELLDSGVVIEEYVVIKNNSREDLIVTVNDALSNPRSINILGRSSIKFFKNSTRNITLSRSGSQSISVSIYGR
jgi:hypothetical protein